MLTSMNSKANVLVDKDSHARLTDFGLTSVIRGENEIISAEATQDTTAWAAPEVLKGGPVSKEGDIFTFAMVAVEVCVRGVSDGGF